MAGKMRIKRIIGVAIGLAFVALVVAMAFPQIAATQYGYFDENNGRDKIEYISFGRVYRVLVQDTEYSKLLKRLGYKETPAEWKLARRQPVGLWKLFPHEFVDYKEGTIEAQSRMFAMAIELKNLDETKAREFVDHFRTLIQKGNSSELRQCVSLLQQEK